jgi:hypothetical protein
MERVLEIGKELVIGIRYDEGVEEFFRVDRIFPIDYAQGAVHSGFRNWRSIYRAFERKSGSSELCKRAAKVMWDSFPWEIRDELK